MSKMRYISENTPYNYYKDREDLATKVTGYKGGGPTRKDSNTESNESFVRFKKNVYNRIPADASAFMNLDNFGLSTGISALANYFFNKDNYVENTINKSKEQLKKIENISDEELKQEWEKTNNDTKMLFKTPENWLKYMYINNNQLIALEDAKDVYLGMPQRNNTITTSSYKPTIGSKNKKYYTSSFLKDKNVIDQYIYPAYNRLKLNKPLEEEIIGKSGNNIVTKMPLLGNATIGSGYDDKGDYISIYDKWDVGSLSGSNNKKGIVDKIFLGNKEAPEFYDRIYLDDYYGITSDGISYLPEVVITPKNYQDGGPTVQDDEFPYYGTTLPTVVVYPKGTVMFNGVGYNPNGEALQQAKQLAYNNRVAQASAQRDRMLQVGKLHGNIRNATNKVAPYVGAAIGAPLAAIGAGTLLGVLPYFAPGTTLGTIAAETAIGTMGSILVDNISKSTTGKTWGENVSDIVSKIPGTQYAPQWLKETGNLIADMSNPGWYIGAPLETTKRIFTKKLLNISDVYRKDFNNMPTRLLINSESNNAKDALADLVNTGILRPHKSNELYFYKNGLYAKPKRGEYVITPKENSNINFINTSGKYKNIDNFVTPDNICSIDYDVYTPFFGGYRKLNSKQLDLKKIRPDSELWNVDPRTELGKQILRDQHFIAASKNPLIDNNTGKPMLLYHGTPNGGFNVFSNMVKAKGRSTDQGYYTSPNKSYAHRYTKEDIRRETPGKNPEIKELYAKGNFINEDNPILGNMRAAIIEHITPEEVDYLTKLGFDGIKSINFTNSAKRPQLNLFYPNYYKSSSPETFDKNGIKIPLNLRDNFYLNDLNYSTGGNINIKESHKGLFTKKADRAGMGVQQFARHVLANKEDYPTSTIKQANFARNASKWRHELGVPVYF